ncbi:phosphatidylinositol transfer protein alpha isoform-like [Lingula anatina]|uniref:Phosphatidylinositol transfer protein alpha isoform-like n=1 Tax=Lingula anatina TaxID=7574 RepID=A0A1S3JPA5_LINAN|nr:phosphatidylinositol transfer protein alpha isoform-like [Lingula anatina]|eukprot:XP_013411966.1 phosphatidylinositol transfer protein alpha isoform-like [Lingula anatina]
MLIKEFRIVLPLSVEEYHVGQLYSVAEASKNETGGGEGIEVVVNEPYQDSSEVLYDNTKIGDGQYTHKIYHLASKVPRFIRLLAPQGSLEFHEKAWNAFPYCRTVVTNDYMKENFFIKIESIHLPDRGESHNPHNLPDELLAQREIIRIDIANDEVSRQDYKADEDPAKFKSEKTGRGLLDKNWINTTEPVMCAYKLVTCHFKWWGLQNKIEKFIQKSERRIFTNFHRQVFCWIDKWHGMTMEDIRAIEQKTKEELDKQRNVGNVRGTMET